MEMEMKTVMVMEMKTVMVIVPHMETNRNVGCIPNRNIW